MVPDPVDVLLTFLGLLIWPGLTFCIILWKLGHPLLGIMALIVVGESTTKKITKKVVKYIDSNTGRVIKTEETEED